MADSIEDKNSQANFKARYKWWFLVSALIMQLSLIYNLQAILTTQVAIQKTYHIDEISFSHIFTFANIPSIAVPLMAGMLSDRYGTSVIFAFGMLVGCSGQFITTYSSYISNYLVLVLGKMLLESGFYFMGISRSKMFKNWFKNKEIARSVGISSTIDYLAMILSNISYPNIYEHYDSLFVAFSVGSVLMAVAAVFGITQVVLNVKLLSFQNIENSQDGTQSEKSFKNFPCVYWILIPCTALGYTSYYGTKIYISKFFQIRFNFTGGEAGLMLAVAMAAAGITPFVTGVLIDRYGKVNVAIIAASFFIITGVTGNLILPHCYKCILAATPLIMMSIGGSIMTITPIVGTLRLVPSQSLGLALSLNGILTSLMMIIYPMLGGYISEKTLDQYGYFWVFLVNLVLAILCVMLSFSLYIADKKGDKKLSVVPSSGEPYVVFPETGNQMAEINEVEETPGDST